jgi:hypothetical protein
MPSILITPLHGIISWLMASFAYVKLWPYWKIMETLPCLVLVLDNSDDHADLFPHFMLWHECSLGWCHTLSLLLLVCVDHRS